ncbi:endo-1,4-beta-xylanase [Rubinisphaera margarita]|uniref:endo-1,4-beta-xylanase n=1 Tax=Rubinisphaera margarita TaxID=2909586 RepID=UPI001EE785AA|nr:endo-1,4-beta-xylanase [Rubinisphaera margarita]MCG6157541.1 endo-1,4-beta-xylanase [Rubinisphaera margarita]
MGLMRFDLGSADLLPYRSRFEQAFLSSYDGTVFPTRVEVHGTVLHCIRQKSDSGKLNISWPISGFGMPILRTCSLIEREAPYVLAVELARGQLCELKDQAASWEHAGMLVPEQYETLYRDAYRDFVLATFEQHDPDNATRIANVALAKICHAENVLGKAYVAQRLQVRRQRFAHPPALLGCDLGEVPVEKLPDDFAERFGAAMISLDWRSVESEEGTYNWDLFDEQVEWGQKNKLMLVGGPLLDFQENGLPNWVANWKHDILNLQSFLSDYVETVVTRYTGKIRTWEVTARVNTGGLFGYTEDNLLALTGRMIDVARQVDGDSRVFIRIDRPWGDYQARGKHRLTPWHVVDALLRSGMGLAGINLELAIGYEPGRNDARRLLRFSRLIDSWGSFGVPLHVTVACPSRADKDPQAGLEIKVDDLQDGKPWSQEHQAEWFSDFVSLLMAKQPVVGIFWPHLNDAYPHRFPHAGLFNADGEPKIAWDRLKEHRRPE